LPAGVFTVTLKLPGAEIIDDVMVAVSWEWLVTTVARVAPLKTTTEEETKSLPLAVMTKLGGSWEKTILVGEIELRTGTGRALPQRGFIELHPSRSKRTTRHELRRTIREEEFTLSLVFKSLVAASKLLKLTVEPSRRRTLTIGGYASVAARSETNQEGGFIGKDRTSGWATWVPQDPAQRSMHYERTPHFTRLKLRVASAVHRTHAD